MRFKKYLYSLIFFLALIIIGCDLNNTHIKRDIIFIAVGLDYNSNECVNYLTNPPNDIREMAYVFSGLSKKSEYNFIYIPFLMQKYVDTPSNNYPTVNNINYLLSSLKNNDLSYFNAYDGNFSENYTLNSSYESFGNLIDDIQIDENDLIIFYFSGHGQIDTGNFLLQSSKASDDLEYLSIDDFYIEFSTLDATKLIIADSCYSGNLIKEDDCTTNIISTAYNDRFSTIYKKFVDYNTKNYNSTFVLTSALADQKSYPIKTNDFHNNSIFTFYFLKSLGYEFSSDIGEINDYIPCEYNSLINLDSVYKYITKNIDKEFPQVNGGRFCLVLFDFV